MPAEDAPPPRVRIDVWSDYVCPFCYLELPVLDRLAAELGDALAVRWRAYELRPEPEPTLEPDGAYLRTVWERSVHPLARRRGLELRLPPVQPRSRLALEAAAHAREAGRFDAMHVGLFRAFFEEGRDLGSLAVLRAVGAAAGLDPDALARALEDGARTPELARDRALAQELGVLAVPSLLVRPSGAAPEAGVLVQGAQPLEPLLAAARDALAAAG